MGKSDENTSSRDWWIVNLIFILKKSLFDQYARKGFFHNYYLQNQFNPKGMLNKHNHPTSSLNI